MTNLKFNPRTAILTLFIAITAGIRIIFNFNHDISLLANFSPLGAMAIFGGAYFSKNWKAFAFPLLMLFISDIILNQTVLRSYSSGLLYRGWYWVYGAFALMTLVGTTLLRKLTVNRFLFSVLTCVFIHWIVTDFGIWMGSKRYSQDFNGFLACLGDAIPYEWRFLIGTLAYGLILFGLFEWMKRKYLILKTSQETRIQLQNASDR
jgi:hypothetical protein